MKANVVQIAKTSVGYNSLELSRAIFHIKNIMICVSFEYDLEILLNPIRFIIPIVNINCLHYLKRLKEKDKALKDPLVSLFVKVYLDYNVNKNYGIHKCF